MPHFAPIDAQPITGRRPERPWPALAWSMAAHAGLVALILVLAHRTPAPVAREPDKPGAPVTPTVQMIYLTPPPTPRPLPKIVPRPEPAPTPTPEPPMPRDMPRPQVERAPLNVPDDPATAAATSPAASASAPAQSAAPASAPPPAAAPSAPGAGPPAPRQVADAAPTLESEAQRLFGPRRVEANTGPSPQFPGAARPTDDRENDCTPEPRPPRAPRQRIALEYVEGTVYYDATRRTPLPGAHLQISGTAYGAFADDRGHYRLGFDPTLIDNCRSQYVRVLAPGVPPQLIVLGRGSGGTDIYVRR